MQPFQQRVIFERESVAEKRTRLLAFMQTRLWPELDPAERSRMERQAAILGQYLSVLDERIAAFPPPPAKVKP